MLSFESPKNTLARASKIIASLGIWFMLNIELNYQHPGNSFFKSIIEFFKLPLKEFDSILRIYYSLLCLILILGVISTIEIFNPKVQKKKTTVIISLASILVWIFLSYLVHQSPLNFKEYNISSLPFISLTFLAFILMLTSQRLKIDP